MIQREVEELHLQSLKMLELILLHSILVYNHFHLGHIYTILFYHLVQLESFYLIVCKARTNQQKMILLQLVHEDLEDSFLLDSRRTPGSGGASSLRGCPFCLSRR